MWRKAHHHHQRFSFDVINFVMTMITIIVYTEARAPFSQYREWISLVEMTFKFSDSPCGETLF